MRVTGNEFIPPARMTAGVRAIRLVNFSSVTLENNTFRNWPGGRERAASRGAESGGKPDAHRDAR